MTVQNESVNDVPSFKELKGPLIVQWLDVPGQPKTKVYLSERGIPLLCQTPGTFGNPIVTLENYEKWYGPYILHHNGLVEAADPGDLSDINTRLGGGLIGDHNFHPRLLNELAKHIGGEADWRAIEMAGGRWVSEQLDGRLPGLPNFDPPYSG